MTVASKTNDLLDAALNYAGRGWPVLPIHWPRDGRCSCGKSDCDRPGKHPRTRHGWKDATTHESTIREWWERWPDANVAIATGPPSGIFVIDTDTKNDGPETLRVLETKNGDLPATPEAVTGSGGGHIIFLHPGCKVTSRDNVQPGVDIKGDGGYIIAAPSRHISGGVYRWDEGRGPSEIEVAEAPPWVLDLAMEQSTNSQQRATTHEHGGRLWERATAYTEKADRMSEGERNKAAFSLAGHIASFVEGTARLDESQILELVRSWNDGNAPPLSDSELQRVVQSAMYNGTPREPHVVRQAADTTKQFDYQFLDVCDFLDVDVNTEQLVNGILPRGQWGIMAAPKFVLKTTISIELAISLACRKNFLNRFPVPEARNVCVVSTESGVAKLQTTVRAIADSKGLDARELAGRLSITTAIPSLDNAACLDAMRKEIVSREASLFILDAAYMMMGRASGDVGNKFSMGNVLRELNPICEDTNCSIMLVCHNNKYREKGKEFSPPDKQEIAQAGFIEWARFFILLQRRKEWETGSFNQHSLWMDVHGSEGYSGLWSIDVKENFYKPNGPLVWEPFVQSGKSQFAEDKCQKEIKADRKKEKTTNEHWDKVLKATKKFGTRGETKTQIKVKSSLNSKSFDPAFQKLLDDGKIENCGEIKKDNGRTYSTFRAVEMVAKTKHPDTRTQPDK